MASSSKLLQIGDLLTKIAVGLKQARVDGFRAGVTQEYRLTKKKMKYYKDSDEIQAFCKHLAAQTVEEFENDISHPVVHFKKLVGELEDQLTQVTQKVLEKNKRKSEAIYADADLEVKEAVKLYKEVMEIIIINGQEDNIAFKKEEDLDREHAAVKQILEQALLVEGWSSAAREFLKLAWEAQIEKEYQGILGKWKKMGFERLISPEDSEIISHPVVLDTEEMRGQRTQDQGVTKEVLDENNKSREAFYELEVKEAVKTYQEVMMQNIINDEDYTEEDLHSDHAALKQLWEQKLLIDGRWSSAVRESVKLEWEAQMEKAYEEIRGKWKILDGERINKRRRREDKLKGLRVEINHSFKRFLAEAREAVERTVGRGVVKYGESLQKLYVDDLEELMQIIRVNDVALMKVTTTTCARIGSLRIMGEGGGGRAGLSTTETPLWQQSDSDGQQPSTNSPRGIDVVVTRRPERRARLVLDSLSTSSESEPDDLDNNEDESRRKVSEWDICWPGCEWDWY